MNKTVNENLYQPMISVVIPTYNRPAMLCELLESLARQTYRNFEVIIVNDCGDSVDFVRELYAELPISVITQEVNRKHVAARNRGVQAAAGEWIMLCDDDDLLLPSHMATMIEAIADADLVYSDVEIFDYRVEEGTRIPTSRLVFAYEFDLAAMRKFSTFVSSGCLYRKAIHDSIGFFDEEVYHYWDWDFILRVAKGFRVKRVPIAGVLYAFSNAGDNLSGNVESMRPFLNKLSAKHQLGDLPVKNFFLLLEEPFVKNRRAKTKVLWDGASIQSRLPLERRRKNLQ